MDANMNVRPRDPSLSSMGGKILSHEEELMLARLQKMSCRHFGLLTTIPIPESDDDAAQLLALVRAQRDVYRTEVQHAEQSLHNCIAAMHVHAMRVRQAKTKLGESEEIIGSVRAMIRLRGFHVLAPHNTQSTGSQSLHHHLWESLTGRSISDGMEDQDAIADVEDESAMHLEAPGDMDM